MKKKPKITLRSDNKEFPDHFYIYVDGKKSRNYLTIINSGRWIGLWLHDLEDESNTKQLGIWDAELERRKNG